MPLTAQPNPSSTIPRSVRSWDDLDLPTTESKTPERAAIARRALTGAVIAGVMFDQLSRGGAPGIGLSLWVGLMTLIALTLFWERRGALGTAESWLLAASVFFGLVPSWADAETPVVLSMMASAGCMILAGAASTGAFSLATARLRDLFTVGLSAALNAAAGAPVLAFGDSSWQLRGVRTEKKSLAVLRGVLIATPLVLVFAALFSSADAGFRSLANIFPTLDLGAIAPHLFVSALIAWPLAGWLRATVVIDPPARSESPKSETFSLPSIGRVELVTVLGALDALFLVFVLVRLRYAFGGDALVRRTLHLSYAEYAREGFFQLVWVAILTIPTLLGAHALARKDDPRSMRSLRVLGTGLVALLGVVMLSALDRMRIYTAAYGLTVDRLYATIFMLWLGVVVAWLSMTVLRGRGERFLIGALISGLGTLGAVSYARTDAFVVRVNAQREARTGRAMDALYAARLGAEAVPSLVPVLLASHAASASDSTALASRCRAATVLLNQWGEPRPGSDWRGWSVARMQARRAVDGERRALGRISCPGWDKRERDARAH